MGHVSGSRDGEEDPRSPVGWAAFLIGGWLVAVALIRWLVPDDLPSWLVVAILVSVVVVLTVANRVIRRGFLRAWWEAGSPPG